MRYLQSGALLLAGAGSHVERAFSHGADRSGAARGPLPPSDDDQITVNRDAPVPRTRSMFRVAVSVIQAAGACRIPGRAARIRCCRCRARCRASTWNRPTGPHLPRGFYIRGLGNIDFYLGRIAAGVDHPGRRGRGACRAQVEPGVRHRPGRGAQGAQQGSLFGAQTPPLASSSSTVRSPARHGRGQGSLSYGSFNSGQRRCRRRRPVEQGRHAEAFACRVCTSIATTGSATPMPVRPMMEPCPGRDVMGRSHPSAMCACRSWPAPPTHSACACPAIVRDYSGDSLDLLSRARSCPAPTRCRIRSTGRSSPMTRHRTIRRPTRTHGVSMKADLRLRRARR